MKKQAHTELSQRVVTFLNRRELDFLDKFGKDALFSTGFKLSRAKLIAWMVDFAKKLNINGEGVKSENDFENRIKRILMAKSREGSPTSHGINPSTPPG